MNERVLRAVAPFGAGLPGSRFCRTSGVMLAADRVVSTLDTSPGVVLLTGHSGSGKTSVLRAVASLLLARGTPAVRADQIRLTRTRPVAAMAARVALESWLGCLSRAGLADARLFATEAGALSEGERARLQLAVAFSRVERPCSGVDHGRVATLVCDEFCSTLDRDTAAGVAAALRRWATAQGVRVLVASAHADLERLLGPDTIVRTRNIGGEIRADFSEGAGRACGPHIGIEEGTMEDYRELAGLHYRSGRPASVCRVLRAIVPTESGTRIAGVLVVSHPTLNGAWRELAWPGRYVGPAGERRRCARRLNREVRRISRVIVDPRDRGRGIARRLVRTYLDAPLTPATEAVSAMGRLSPFGRSAGMIEYQLPPRRADDRLADMLAQMSIEPWSLFDTSHIESLRTTDDGPWLSRELQAWARAVRTSIPKPMRDAGDSFALAPLAASRLCAPPVAYAHVY